MKRDGKSKFKNTIKVSLSDQYGSCTITSHMRALCSTDSNVSFSSIRFDINNEQS